MISPSSERVVSSGHREIEELNIVSEVGQADSEVYINPAIPKYMLVWKQGEIMCELR